MKKDAKLKEKKSKAWKQRQGEQKQAQAKKQKRYAPVKLTSQCPWPRLCVWACL